MELYNRLLIGRWTRQKDSKLLIAQASCAVTPACDKIVLTTGGKNPMKTLILFGSALSATPFAEAWTGTVVDLK